MESLADPMMADDKAVLGRPTEVPNDEIDGPLVAIER
jgi:hypothetical protein